VNGPDSADELFDMDSGFEECVYVLLNEYLDSLEAENPDTVPPQMAWRRGTGSVPRGTLYSSFASWVNRAYYDEWFECTKRNGADRVRDVLEQRFENDGEFRHRCEKHITVVNERHKRVGSMANVGKQGNLEEETDMEDEFETLESIGAVDGDGNVDLSKIRGLCLQFADEVEEVGGGGNAVDLDDLTARFNEWMLRKLGGEWSRFTSQIIDDRDVKACVKYMWNANEEFQSLIAEKWYDNSDEMDDLSGHEKRQKKQRIDGYNDDRIDGSNDGVKRSDNGVDGGAKGAEADRTEDVEVNSVFNRDSTDFIDDLVGSDLTIDAVITDPPYGQSYDSRGDDHSVIEGDGDLDKALNMTEEVLKKCRMTMSSGSPIVCFAGDTSLSGVMEMMDRWYTLKPVCVWDKDWVTTSSMADTPMAWRKSHEYAVIGVYKEPRVENENRHEGTVWKCQRLSGDSMDHPTQKPVELMKYVVESLTEEGDVVFDPFAGSGSTLVAANQLDRGYVGVEYDEQHFELIEDRLKQDTLAGWTK